MAAAPLRKASSRILQEYPSLSAHVARGEARAAYKRAFAAQSALVTRERPTHRQRSALATEPAAAGGSLLARRPALCKMSKTHPLFGRFTKESVLQVLGTIFLPIALIELCAPAFAGEALPENGAAKLAAYQVCHTLAVVDMGSAGSEILHRVQRHRQKSGQSKAAGQSCDTLLGGYERSSGGVQVFRDLRADRPRWRQTLHDLRGVEERPIQVDWWNWQIQRCCWFGKLGRRSRPCQRF